LWGAWATIGLGLAIGLLFLAAQTVVLMGFLVAKLAKGPISDLVDYVQGMASNGLVVSLSTIVSAIAGASLIILFVRIRGNKNVSQYIGLRRISKKTVVIILAVFILSFAGITGLETLYNALTGITSADSVNSNFMIDTYNSAGWLPLLWVAVVLFAPMFEEAFFRGFLFAGLEHSRIGAVGTIILTSLVWASLHLQYDIIGMTTIVILGVVMGVVRYKTRSLWSTILMHSLWNFVALFGTALSLKG
jgi:membrane protease YdiL (CAAX protease family)